MAVRFLFDSGVHQRFRDGRHGDGLVEGEFVRKHAVDELLGCQGDGRGHGAPFDASGLQALLYGTRAFRGA